MGENISNIISNGLYFVFQKKNYKKLHLISEKSDCIFIGKDKIELHNVLGKPIESTFQLVPKPGFNRHFTLQLCTAKGLTSVKESCKELNSGCDNRSICDDGLSQMLTKDSIEELRDRGTTPQAILEQLIENSKTFQEKTEYSQEKYIDKKEKKYFDFITIRHPTIRLIADIFYNRDITKSVGIRIDTLSQLGTALNFHSSGKYILVESGYRGIVAASLLNLLSDKGRIVHITPEQQNQKQAVLAMNFTSSHLSQLITIRMSTMTDFIDKNKIVEDSSSTLIGSDCNSTVLETSDFAATINNKHQEPRDTYKNENNDEQRNIGVEEVRKRKITYDEPCIDVKKPRWMAEAELAIEIISQKVDGLIIACKECSVNILNNLLEYVLQSRSFVVYSLYQEPLVSLYLELKKRQDIINLKITETIFRPYQILPERTHPIVTVSSTSGYLLSGIKVSN